MPLVPKLGWDVGYGSEADIQIRVGSVRCTLESRHCSRPAKQHPRLIASPIIHQSRTCGRAWHDLPEIIRACSKAPLIRSNGGEREPFCAFGKKTIDIPFDARRLQRKSPYYIPLQAAEKRRVQIGFRRSVYRLSQRRKSRMNASCCGGCRLTHLELDLGIRPARRLSGLRQEF